MPVRKSGKRHSTKSVKSAPASTRRASTPIDRISSAVSPFGSNRAIFASGDVLARNHATAARMAALAAPLAGLPHVADVRQAGMILAIELAQGGDRRTPLDPALRVGLHAYRAALARGVVLRPLGDILYWMPPYCVDDEQLQLLARVTREAIEEATACA